MKRVVLLFLMSFIFILSDCNANENDKAEASTSELEVIESTNSSNSEDEFLTDYYFQENAYYDPLDISELKHFLDTEGDVEIINGYEEYPNQKWSEREDIQKYFTWVRERGSAPIIYPNNDNAEIFHIEIKASNSMSYFILEDKHKNGRIWIQILPLSEKDKEKDLKALIDSMYGNGDDKQQFQQRNNNVYGEHYVYTTRDTNNNLIKHIDYRYKDCLIRIRASEGISIEIEYTEWFDIKEYTPNYE